jgi:hypothetical protein
MMIKHFGDSLSMCNLPVLTTSSSEGSQIGCDFDRPSNPPGRLRIRRLNPEQHYYPEQQQPQQQQHQQQQQHSVG